MSAMDNRLIEQVRDLERRVAELQQSPSIRILEEDPDPESSLVVWMLSDGRLRGRRPNGTVVEYAFSNHAHAGVDGNAMGGSSSTAEALPAPYIPQSMLVHLEPEWIASFQDDGQGLSPATDRLAYGQIGAARGEEMAMVKFGGLEPLLGAIRIHEVRLSFLNLESWTDEGASLFIGLHDRIEQPLAFGTSEWPVAEVTVGRQTRTTHILPLRVGEALADGTAQGITFFQKNTTLTSAGALAREGISLEVEFSK